MIRNDYDIVNWVVFYRMTDVVVSLGEFPQLPRPNVLYNSAFWYWELDNRLDNPSETSNREPRY